MRKNRQIGAFKGGEILEIKIDIEKVELLPNDPFYTKKGIGKYRQWFSDAVDFWKEWQEEAREDYELWKASNGARQICVNLRKQDVRRW